MRPKQTILETIHPCCALYSNVWTTALDRWKRNPATDSHYLPYDLHISEREVRWHLWAIHEGHPITDVSAKRRNIVRSLVANFPFEPYESPVWRKLHAWTGSLTGALPHIA